MQWGINLSAGMATLFKQSLHLGDDIQNELCWNFQDICLSFLKLHVSRDVPWSHFFIWGDPSSLTLVTW